MRGGTMSKLYFFKHEMENNGLNWGFEISSNEDGEDVIECLWFASEDERDEAMLSEKEYHV
jgi:hypothetical protein